MELLVSALHVLVCLCLVAIVLLQHGKGADMGVALGGGASNTIFGARGAGNFLTKLTTGAAVLFMVTSLLLSRWSTQSDLDNLLEQAPQTETPGALAPEDEPDFAPVEPLEGGAAESDAPAGFEAIEPEPAAEAAPEPAEPSGEAAP